MSLSVEKSGDVTIVAIDVDQFNVDYADQFKLDVAPALKGTRKLLLDLSAVTFVDSRACGAILSCLKRLNEVDGELKICHVHPFVREVFGLIRLHRICEIVDTRDDAIRAFAAAKAGNAV